MRTLSEIYQANRAQSIALEKALAEAQLRLSQRDADAQRNVVNNFTTRKFGDKVLTDDVTKRIEQLSSEQLDELLFQSASWNSPTQLQNYFNLESI
jgi:hypothetical protein